MSDQFIYVAMENSDLTEGRGHLKAIGYFLIEEDAVKAVKGRGVQGVGDGAVYRCPVGIIGTSGEQIYGYRKNWNGKWGYGWVDNRDAPTNDPEYAEYQRLREKFQETTDE